MAHPGYRVDIHLVSFIFRLMDSELCLTPYQHCLWFVCGVSHTQLRKWFVWRIVRLLPLAF
jgi:hypothetical protein